MEDNISSLETWKEIYNFPNYLISDCGRVKSLKTIRNGQPIIMKLGLDKDGYFTLVLCKNNIKFTRHVHRLVASTFIDNPLELPCINHIDENKQNNSVSNLEWCTVKYNNEYKNGASRRASLRKRAIIQLSVDGSFIKMWDSRASIVKETGFCGGNVTSVCTGNRKTANGFKWKYA